MTFLLYLVISMTVGIFPFRGRIDTAIFHKDRDSLWYEARNFLQKPHVLLTWHLRMLILRAQGRMFVVPGDGYSTTWDDRYTWARYFKDLPTKSYHLRVRHNHCRHDMDNDAIVIAFQSARDLATFKSRLPAGGPVQFDSMALLDDKTRLMASGLLQRNRERTEAGL